MIAANLSACGRQSFSLGGGNADAAFAQCEQLSKKKKNEQAIECLEIFKSRYAGTAQSAAAEVGIADAFFRQKDYLLAAESYEQFLRAHPLHDKADYAFFRLGLSYLQASPKALDRDQDHIPQAINAFKTQLRLFPDSTFHEASREQLKRALIKQGGREFYVGNFYYRTGEYRSAIPRLLVVITQYPMLPNLPKAYYLLTMSFAKVGMLDESREVFTEMVEKYPKDKWTSKAERKLRSIGKQAKSKKDSL